MNNSISKTRVHPLAFHPTGMCPCDHAFSLLILLSLISCSCILKWGKWLDTWTPHENPCPPYDGHGFFTVIQYLCTHNNREAFLND